MECPVEKVIFRQSNFTNKICETDFDEKQFLDECSVQAAAAAAKYLSRMAVSLTVKLSAPFSLSILSCCYYE